MTSLIFVAFVITFGFAAIQAEPLTTFGKTLRPTPASRIYDVRGRYAQPQYENAVSYSTQYSDVNDGRYVHDDSGSYRHDGSGAYYPDNSGAYVPDSNPYTQQDDSSGRYYGSSGGAGYGSSLGTGASSGSGSTIITGTGLTGKTNLVSTLGVGPTNSPALVTGIYGASKASAISATSGYGASPSLKQGSAAGLYDNRNYAIIRKVEQVEQDGYHYLYETENGIFGEEEGHVVNKGTDNEIMKARGLFSYTGPDNVVYTVEYTADENGFVPHGAHLPTPPPIPEAIVRSLEYQRSIGEL